MHSVFAEAAIGQALAKTIEALGAAEFWHVQRSLFECMGEMQNALVTYFEAGQCPQVLDGYSAYVSDAEATAASYLSGLYLLDPFYQACNKGLASGVYRLREVAPDLFLQSEYYTSYFNEVVGQDEVQLILALPQRRYLCVSLGFKSRPDVRLLGMLAFHKATLLALMHQHWRLTLAEACRTPVAEPDASGEQKIELALEHFGAGLLSCRELETARLILRGNSSKAIAAQLNISLDTVKAHRRNLYTKLGISSQPELFNIFLKALG